MAKPFYGDLEFKGQQTVRWADSDSSNVVSLGAPATVATDLALVLPASDTANGALVSDGSGNLSLSLIANANISGSAAIAYSKLALTDSIVNADINSAAAIAYSKLNLSNSIVNADINASAAIAESKLALDQNTADLATRTLNNLTTTAINTSLVSDTDNTDNLGSASIAWATGFINVLSMDSNAQTTSIQGSAAATASVTYSLPPADGTSGFVLSTNGSGVLSWVSNASSSSHAEDWDTADTATFAITHSLGTQDVIVQVYDRTTEETIDIDSVVRTDANTVTVTASEAPPVGGWRVLILAV